MPNKAEHKGLQKEAETTQKDKYKILRKKKDKKTAPQIIYFKLGSPSNRLKAYFK